MRLIEEYHRRLGWKLFLSYVLVIGVGAFVLVVAAELQTPTALSRHISQMQALVGENEELVRGLHESFTGAVTEIVAVGAVASGLAALIMSALAARRIVDPIERMIEASRRIAAGDYRHRVDVVGHDELGALAADFNRMAEALERTEERRLALLGDVAHELRTPLSNIANIMEALIDEALPPDAATFVGVQREVNRLGRLVLDLEELSRAEAGEVQLEFETVKPADLVSAAVDRLQPQFQDRDMALNVDVPQDLPAVWVDPGRIAQVLLNLLGNALQYTQPGDEVAVRSWSDGDFVYVEVRDSGLGIDGADLPHVFDRFYRVDKSRSRVGGGSGIGLTISRHLTEANGGRIWATSAGLGSGSTFTFTMPVAR